jgi:hypothetical protein
MARSSLKLLGLIGLTLLALAVGAWVRLVYKPPNSTVTIKLPPPETATPGFKLERSGTAQ